MLNRSSLNIVGKMQVRVPEVEQQGGFSSGKWSFGTAYRTREWQSGIHTSRSGFDGIIGRPIFANLVVEVDWEKHVVRLFEPASYKYSGSGSILPLTFDDGGRPYTMASVTTGAKTIPVKLVVDTGGSHALSLDVGSNSEITLPEGVSKTALGRGASGEIAGYTGRVKALELGGQTYQRLPTIFPIHRLEPPSTAGREILEAAYSGGSKSSTTSLGNG
jgi:hypothetical protein